MFSNNFTKTACYYSQLIKSTKLNVKIGFQQLQISIPTRKMMDYLKSLFSTSQSKHLTYQQRQIFRMIKNLQYDELIQFIHQERPNLNFCQQYGQKITPLLLAINSGNDEFKKNREIKASYKITHLLLNHGANPDCQDASGRTPLIAACHWNLPQLADLLIDSGAEINLSSSKSPYLNPLYVCLFKRRLQMAKSLLKRGASVIMIHQLNHINKKQQQGFNLQQPVLEWLSRLQNKKKGVALVLSLREHGRPLMSRQLEKQLLSQFL